MRYAISTIHRGNAHAIPLERQRQLDLIEVASNAPEPRLLHEIRRLWADVLGGHRTKKAL